MAKKTKSISAKIRVVKNPQKTKSKFLNNYLQPVVSLSAALILVLQLVAPAMVSAVDPAPSWPTTWTTPAQCAVDPAGDESPDEVDIVGNTSNPAVGFASDTNYQYFRERIDGNPGTASDLDSHSWVVLFQTSKPAYQYLASATGKNTTELGGKNFVSLWENSPATTPVDFSPLFNDPAENVLWSGPSATYARVTNAGGGIYYIDWAIPVSQLTSRGIDINTTKFFATSANANNYNKDHLNCYEAIADLTVVKDDNADPINVGDTLTYTLTVTNNGPDTASGTVVSDVLPSGLTYVSSSATVGSYNSITGVWTIGTFANGASATLAINATVNQGTGGSTLVNTAIVSSATLDTTLGNNSDTENTAVNQPPPPPSTGTVVIVKDTEPNDSQDFFYTTTGGLTPASFDLDDDQDGTLSNSQTYNDVPVGTYTVIEGLVTGFDLSDLTCVDPDQQSSGDVSSATATIDLDVDETVTCTFTNTKLPTLTVTKILNPTSDLGLFNLFIDQIASAFDVGHNGILGPITLGIGTYMVSETAGTGTDLNDYISVINGECDSQGNVSLTAGENKNCTVTNTKKGTIIIEKNTVPNSDTDFEFTSLTLPISQFLLDDDEDQTLPNSQTFNRLTPGAYDIAETPNPDYVTSAVCDDGSEPNAIDLGPGEIVTCTFVNAIKQGGIVITKETIPDGDQTQFDFTTDYSEPFSLSDGQSDSSGSLEPGIYSVTEDLPDGWTLKSATCSDGSDPSTIHLSPDETVSCLFTNAKLPRLGVHKILNPTDDPGVFELKIDGGTVGIGQAYSGTYYQTVSVGQHTVSETAVYGTNLDDYVTVFGGDCQSDRTITLAAGEEKVCTIINTKRGKIIVDKITDPLADPQSFDFTTNYNQGFSLADQDTPNDSGWLEPGTYWVSEASVAGWDLTSATCDDGSAPDQIGLGAGETVTCIFTNTKQQEPHEPTYDLAVTKAVNNQSPEPGNEITYTITATNNSSVSVSSVFVNDLLPASVTFVSASTSYGSYDEIGGVWNIGTLAVSETATLEIKATVNSGTAGQSIINEATVDSDDEIFRDSNPDNDTASAASNVPVPSTPSSPGGGGGGGVIYGTLLVKKVVINDNSGTASAANFTIHVKSLNGAEASNSPQPGSAAGTNYNIPVGVYTISEDLLSGYTQTSISGDCSSDGTVSLASGVQKVCTIINDDVAGAVLGEATTTPGEVLGESIEKPGEVLAETGFSLYELMLLILSLSSLLLIRSGVRKHTI